LEDPNLLTEMLWGMKPEHVLVIM